ncbi:MAG: hypothetical protein RIA09_15765 [Hoeflea sp.]|jgi:hypothetical protein|uniref:hypothetical protein n=1 Tax=Hoeflea sp. TaxID=1940281 RepID=UPI0032ED2EA6
MAIGNPRLAVWYTTGDLRLYEFSEGAFVQIAIGGGLFVGASANSTGFLSKIDIAFPWDSEYISVHTPISDAVSRVYTFSSGLIFIDQQDVGALTGTRGRGLATYDYLNNVSIFRPDNGTVVSNQARVLDTGYFADTSPNGFIGGSSVYMRCLEVSPDAKYVIEGRIFPNQAIYHRRTAMNNGHPVFNDPQLLDTDKNVTVAAWSIDGRFAVIGDGINGGVEIHEVDTDNNELKFSHDLAVSVDGVPVAAAFSPDQRMLAVGFDNLGTLKTITYRRSGAFYIQYQILDGIGSLLDFSADGSLLIDGQKRKCYRFDGDFTELSSAMDNVAAGGAVQATSTHAVNPLAFGSLYNGVIGKIVDETIDYSNIRLALLSEFASFDPDHESLSEVNGGGTFSVSSGEYPVNGELLTGVTAVDEDQVFTVKADAITRTIVDTNLVFKFAVAYDATNDQPLAWFDYTQVRTIPKNTELTLTFRDGNLITFAR